MSTQEINRGKCEAIMDSYNATLPRVRDLVGKGIPNYDRSNVIEARAAELKSKGLPFSIDSINVRISDLNIKAASVAHELGHPPKIIKVSPEELAKAQEITAPDKLLVSTPEELAEAERRLEEQRELMKKKLNEIIEQGKMVIG